MIICDVWRKRLRIKQQSLGFVDNSPLNVEVPWFIDGIHGSRGRAAGRGLKMTRGVDFKMTRGVDFKMTRGVDFKMTRDVDFKMTLGVDFKNDAGCDLRAPHTLVF
ncbi:hypothetical protein [Legionella hackeliae]|uniref:hypothetical protein n=1 Tax=Legionella hackeliae TaxID=449 RepID=UPI00072F22A3|nr:hypothetical protein [Legionella hackeliae]KTD10340.1 hypothetical protein Lhac_2708 [Legionella hackeliae]